MSNGYDSFPIEDSRNFEPGKWYPLPTGSMWIDNPTIAYHEAYGIFTLEDGEQRGGDIKPVVNDLTLRQAVEICETYNGEKLPIYGAKEES